MKILILLILFAFEASGQLVRLQRSNFIKPPAGPGSPDTVIHLGRAEDSTSGTTVTTTIADNGFLGDTDGTWSIFGAGSTYPVVHTTQTIFEDGVQVAGGGGLGDSGNTRFWFSRHNEPRTPQFTFTTTKPCVVFSYNFSISNWNGGTFGSYNDKRVGQSPFLIVNFDDGNDGGRQAINCHTGSGQGSYIFITNVIPYRIVAKYETGVDAVVKVYTRDGPGDYRLVGTSTLGLGSAGNAGFIRWSEEDNHSETDGRDTRQDNMMLTYTASDFPNVHLPNY
jgi:hypothetical protein